MRKKEIRSETSNKNPTKSETITDNDFSYVNLDAKIHDVKFETKPTTFWKDAIRRFSKNRSSVIAGAILAILIGMAIIVPIANNSNIDSAANYASYLPPKWFSPNGSGFLDGTKQVNDASTYKTTAGSMSEDTPTSELLPYGYDENAIFNHEISYSLRETSNATESGWGGMTSIAASNHTDNPCFWSPKASLDFSYPYSFEITLAESKNASLPLQGRTRLVAKVYLESDPLFLPLTEWSLGGDSIKAELINQKVAALSTDPFVSSTNVELGLELETNTTYDPSNIGLYPSVYLNSAVISSGQSTPTLLDKSSWNDSNECALRTSSKVSSIKELSWTTSGFATRSIQGVKYYVCSFSYDCYEAAFGIKTMSLDLDVLNSYIEKGYLSYDIDVGVSSFVMNEDICPIRSVTSQTKNRVWVPTANEWRYIYTFECQVSFYRYYGFDSAPSYIFGTNKMGNDYFKYLFAGLSTSLLLGVCCALINITFGLLWGAISGYFGGWTDMVMERFTEILGGVPWIVVMTLCVLLLGQSFQVFLLSLCLTGWMGVASMTRSQFYRYKGREYVLASRTLGSSDWRLIFRHILPNAIGPVVTASVLIVPSVIFDEASVSFLGLGLKGFKSFGVALSEAQNQMGDAPYMIIFGSIIVCLLMICFNLFGNGLRDAFNPSLKGMEE